MCEKLHRPVVPHLYSKGLTAYRAAPDIVKLRLPCAVFSLFLRRTNPPDTIFIFQQTNSIRKTVAECAQKDLLLPKWPAIVVLSEMAKNKLIFVFEICRSGKSSKRLRSAVLLNGSVYLFHWFCSTGFCIRSKFRLLISKCQPMRVQRILCQLKTECCWTYE